MPTRSPLLRARVRTVTPAPDAVVDTLVSEHQQFRRFLIKQVGNAADADDILQQALLKALRRGDSLRADERAVAWFYRILRNAVVDHFRGRKAEQRKLARVQSAAPAEPDAAIAGEFDRAICRCFAGLLPTLKPRYAEVLRRVDLEGEPKREVARHLGVSLATFDVALHRARQALRRRLEVWCGACSREHCLACTCKPPVNGGRSRKL